MAYKVNHNSHSITLSSMSITTLSYPSSKPPSFLSLRPSLSPSRRQVSSPLLIPPRSYSLRDNLLPLSHPQNLHRDHGPVIQIPVEDTLKTLQNVLKQSPASRGLRQHQRSIYYIGQRFIKHTRNIRSFLFICG